MISASLSNRVNCSTHDNFDIFGFGVGHCEIRNPSTARQAYLLNGGDAQVEITEINNTEAITISYWNAQFRL